MVKTENRIPNVAAGLPESFPGLSLNQRAGGDVGQSIPED